jgi:hypothetical protein
MYDESFYGYGKNKIEFITQIRHAGYKFHLLKKAFLIHYPHTESVAKLNWLDKTSIELPDVDGTLSEDKEQETITKRTKELKELNQSQHQNEMNILYSAFTKKLKQMYGSKPDCTLCEAYMDRSTTNDYKVKFWRENNFIDGQVHIINPLPPDYANNKINL